MNDDILKGKWGQLKGKVKEQWGKLTDDEIDALDGRKDQLVGRVQERYGIAREQAAATSTTGSTIRRRPTELTRSIRQVEDRGRDRTRVRSFFGVT